jgi:GGDEF domain-containing protein
MRAQCEDLQNMVAMLTKTMAAITSESQSSISHLQEIEASLQTASALEDFHVAKIRMSECLDVLGKEIVHRRSESAKQVREMGSVVQGLRSSRPHSAEELARKDPLTGLIERAGAEAALAAAVKEGRPAYAAVFVADRLDMINARFGRSVGDDVLVFFCQHIARWLKETDRLYRWTGPAVLAVLHRETSVASVREETNALFARRLTMNVTSENRSVLLAVPAKWMVFAAQEIRPLPRLIKSIDAFVHGEPPEAKAAAAS